VIYLGADLPARDIAQAVRQAGAQAVALSLVFHTSEPELAEELRRVRQGVGPDVEILVGGAAADTYRILLDEIGARVLADLAEMRAALRELAAKPSGGISLRGDAVQRHVPHVDIAKV
jgi:MerR family transcriptional regulator, light-induced transcriptional regulator